jgi:hypothetical protein
VRRFDCGRCCIISGTVAGCPSEFGDKSVSARGLGDDKFTLARNASTEAEKRNAMLATRSLECSHHVYGFSVTKFLAEGVIVTGAVTGKVITLQPQVQRGDNQQPLDQAIVAVLAGIQTQKTEGREQAG